MDLRYSIDFKKWATFKIRINECSIYYKWQNARMDAGYYVIINYKGQQVYRTALLSEAIITAMNTPNSKRRYLKYNLLTATQKKRIKETLRKDNERYSDFKYAFE